ncbi:hypothetical protein EU537_10375 [Candidatus Thorarchaeota archaeon]|nr:MAG: hypothetical protein EU537_10375 [Candidatus Thorarchaeota archaeon]
MSSDLERALSKLRFDDQVLGYSLMTNGGRPFVSFSFPDELFPRVKDSISLYKSDLRLMTIDTEKGLVVLSPVDEHWILTVLYVPELQLGLAIAKTKNVLRMLEGIELPPPPDEFEESAEGNLQVLESIGIQAASTTAEEPEAAEVSATPEAEPVEEIHEAEAEERSPEDFRVTPSTVPKRGSAYAKSLSLDSELSSEMKKTYRNFGFDVLMLVDGNLSISQVADSMFQSTERVIECIKWAASKNIVDVPVIEAEGGEGGRAGTMGQFVKCPKFEGDLSKAKDADKDILRFCDGKRTTEEVAEAAGVQKQMVIKILAKYRKNVSMIGKTL